MFRSSMLHCKVFFFLFLKVRREEKRQKFPFFSNGPENSCPKRQRGLEYRYRPEIRESLHSSWWYSCVAHYLNPRCHRGSPSEKIHERLKTSHRRNFELQTAERVRTTDGVWKLEREREPVVRIFSSSHAIIISNLILLSPFIFYLVYQRTRCVYHHRGPIPLKFSESATCRPLLPSPASENSTMSSCRWRLSHFRFGER